MEGDEAVRAFASELGEESRDRRLRNGFDRLHSYGEIVQGVRDSRARVDRLYPILEDITNAVELLWDMVRVDE